MSDRPKAILVGGVYGSGKSTLAAGLRGLASVVDYDTIIGDLQDNGLEKSEELFNDRRAFAWREGFLNALVESATCNNPLTIGFGTFTTRERRDRYFDRLSQVAEVRGIYLMPPMRESIRRIKTGRPSGSKLVNASSVFHFYRIHNSVFLQENHGDLDVPDDIAPEYKVMLSKSGYYQTNELRRWKVITKPLEPTELIGFSLSASVSQNLSHSCY